MSQSNTPRPEAAVDPNKTAKFLANLQRTVGRRDPDDAPASPAATSSTAVAPSAPTISPPVASPPRAVLAESSPVSVQDAGVDAETPRAAKPAVRRKTKDAARDAKLAVEVTLDPGTASRVVYIRVDKTLADRLSLIAFQNKINGGSTGPATINDIGVAALNRWLDEYEEAA